MNSAEIIDAFRQAMRAEGLGTDDAIVADGRAHRYHVKDDRPSEKNGVFALHADGTPAGWFGSHRGGFAVHTWVSKRIDTLTADEREKHRKRMEAACTAREKEERRRHDEAARKAVAIWSKAAPAPENHPYLARKRVQSYGLRAATWRKWERDAAGKWAERAFPGALLVPLRNAAGELRSLQAILPEKAANDRDKDFLFGGEKRACWFWIGEPAGDGPLLLAEGYATGASLHEATGYPVAVAFDAGNLQPVALAVRAKYPAAALVIAADNDHKTEGNPGLSKARAAARAAGAALAWPEFAEDEPGTDWNDSAAIHGAAPLRAAVAKAIEEAAPPARPDAPSADSEPPPSADSEDGEPAPPEFSPRFVMDSAGLWANERNQAGKPRRRFIVEPFKVLALVRDPTAAGWGLLLEISDPDGRPHRVTIPHAHLRGEGVEALAALLDRGFVPRLGADRLLIEYLREQKPTARARVIDRAGWHGPVFVLPDRTVGDEGEPFIYSGPPGASQFKVQGTLDQWKAEVAARCVGNSRLIFACSVAFAAPLLALAGVEGGGFHYRGASSDGKSTLLRVAASIAGPPEYVGRWRATANGLEAFAAAHSDCPALLDELAQIDPKEAADCAYMLSNGQGKARASQTGAARPRAAWRLLFQSAGEVGLAEHLAEAGRRAKAGQEIRLCEIPADAAAGFGCFEDLHNAGNGSDFARELDQATRRYYGAAWLAYLERLVQERDHLPDVLAGFAKRFEGRSLTAAAEGQARRVAARFALAGAAGELASDWGITGWPAGTALEAAERCFRDWLGNRGGAGNSEERTVLRQVREFLRRYGESAFSDWDRPAVDGDTRAAVRSDRVGYRKTLPGDEGIEFFIFVEMWNARVCSGLDPKHAGRLLVDRGYAERGTEADRPYTTRVRFPAEGRARVVHILPSIFEGGAGDD